MLEPVLVDGSDKIGLGAVIGAARAKEGVQSLEVQSVGVVESEGVSCALC